MPLLHHKCIYDVVINKILYCHTPIQNVFLSLLLHYDMLLSRQGFKHNLSLCRNDDIWVSQRPSFTQCFVSWGPRVWLCYIL